MSKKIAKNNISEKWNVYLHRSAEKQYNKLKRSGSKPSITDIINLLLIELTKEGPYRTNWPSYGPLEKGEHQCHLKDGRPTFVACWKVLDEEKKIIEVYYVGTHENAPY